MKKFPLLFLFVLLLPLESFAQIEITEIMYDLEGSDTKREWVEIYNNSDAPVDLSDWRFFDGSNHKFNGPPEGGGQGSIVVEALTYAVITSDAATFLTDNPLVDVSVIDTVMSLNNTADLLQIKNTEGIVVNELSYDNTLGAVGDGLSLQLIDGNLTARTPTPGKANSIDTPPAIVEDEEEVTQDADVPTTTSGSSWPVEPQIFAFAGPEKRTAIVGGTIFFTGDALGLLQEPLQNAHYVWSFGDGGRGEGVEVAHTYYYPGTYVVMLDVSSGKYSATDRVYVTVDEAKLVVSSEEGFISIENLNTEEIDLSGWRLSVNNLIFTIPKNTILLKNTNVIFPEEITNLETNKTSTIQLQYPNGEASNVISKEFAKAVPIIEIKNSVSQNIETPPASIIQQSTPKNLKENISQYVSVKDNLVSRKVESEIQVLAQTVEPEAIIPIQPIEKESEVEKIEELPIQVAAAPLAFTEFPESTNPITPWLLGVMGIVAIGLLGVYVSRLSVLQSSPIKREADLYDLIDESDIETK